MSSNFINGSAVYLHTFTDGAVWAGRRSEVPVPFDGNFEELLNYKFVRVLGTQANAQLIIELAKVVGLAPLQLGSPAFLVRAAESPVNTIYKMRQYLMPAAVGGWHPVTDIDMATYHMAVGELAIQEHPIWPRAAFVANIDPDNLTKIMLWLMDPRWLSVVSNPDHITKICTFLGLSSDSQSDFRAGKSTSRTERFVTVCQAWSSNGTHVDDIDLPRNFLHAHCLGYPEGIYRVETAKLFINFLVWNWRQILADATPQRPQLFSPMDVMGKGLGAAFNFYLNRQNICQPLRS